MKNLTAGTEWIFIPKIKFFVQRRYRANWPFVDEYQMSTGIV